MRRLRLLFLFLPLLVFAEGKNDCADEYYSGYIQALINRYYYEYDVRVVLHDGVAHVFNLPNNCQISTSILRYISDMSCVCQIVPHCCSPEEYFHCCEEDVECHHYPTMCDVCGPCRINGIWMPQGSVLFQPLIADPRQVMNAAALRFNDDAIGKHVGAPSFGDDFIIFRWFNPLCTPGDMDIGIQAGIFSVFDLDHIEACMVNTDFFVALMLTYAVDCWSYRFRLWHLSSHLGDEFIISNPDHDRFNLSDEGVDLFASLWLGHAIRLYAGIGYIYSRDKEFPEHPLYVEGGSEIRVYGWRSCYNQLYIQPFLAMHFRSWEDHGFDIDQTYALGLEWSKLQGVGRKFRLYFEYHDGFSREGQFSRTRSNYFAVKVSYSY